MSTRETYIQLFNHSRRMLTSLLKLLRPHLMSGGSGASTPMNTSIRHFIMILHLRHMSLNFILKNMEMQMKLTWFWKPISTFSKFAISKCSLKHINFIRPIQKSAILYLWKLFILKSTWKSCHNQWYHSASNELPVVMKFQLSTAPSAVVSSSKFCSVWSRHFTRRSTEYRRRYKLFWMNSCFPFITRLQSFQIENTYKKTNTLINFCTIICSD